MRWAVCDDEPFMREDAAARLLAYAEKKGLAFRVDVYADGRELLAGREFDAVLLDICMEGRNGMDTARQLRREGFDGPLIFLTVLKEAVFDSFEVRAFDYLVKPLEEERFFRTMDRVTEAWEKRGGKKLLIQRGGVCQVVPYAQILYCEVIGRKLYLHQKGGRVTDYYGKMEELQASLDGRFFRCHRSYLVNLDQVRSALAGQAVLTDGSEVPVSRSRGPELMRALLAHMKERRV